MALFWITSILAAILILFLASCKPTDGRDIQLRRLCLILTAAGYCIPWGLYLTLKVIPDMKAQEAVNLQIEETYYAAAELAAQAQYTDAIALLDSVDAAAGTEAIGSSDYRRLRSFCSGMLVYQTGDWEAALRQIPTLDFRLLTGETKRMLHARRDSALAGCRKMEKKEQQRQYQLGLEQAQNTTGYVGMSEAFVSKTLLGAPHSRKTTYPWKEPPITYYYYYYFGDYYTLTCQSGVVIKVSHNTPSHSTRKSGDPYRAKDYDDPEDFYEDHYDDFDGFEDAEDYFDGMHGY